MDTRVAQPHDDALADLDAEVRRALRHLGDEPENWVPPTPGVDHDVTIVGAGQSGLAIAFALRRAGIHGTTLLDAASPGRTGTWTTKARMRTLRTAKRITGPELGIPALSFPAWYEAQHGEAAYTAMDLIPLADWAAYLDWYARVTGARVRHGTRLLGVEPAAGGGLRLHLATPEGERRETTRKLVLATGGAGAGAPGIPPVVAAALPRDRYAHTDETIDFERLRGKVVGVVGAAASAFDAAGVALEQGAEAVHLFCRSPDLTLTMPAKTASYAGAAGNYVHLSDEERWHLGGVLRGRAPSPPRATVRRATGFANFHLHLGAPANDLRMEGDRIRFQLPDGSGIGLDFLVLGTGYRMDPALRPELAALAPHIALWRDRHPPATRDGRGGFPYLGDGFEFLERRPGSLPCLRDVHLFSYGALESFGRHIGDVASLAPGVPKLVAALARDLFTADREQHIARMLAPVPLELAPEDYRHAVRSGG